MNLLSPRFDSPWPAALNVIGVGLWVLALVLVVRRHRRGRGVDGWDIAALLVHISADGVYVPLGPILWLLSRARSAIQPASSTGDDASVPLGGEYHGQVVPGDQASGTRDR